MAGPLTALLVAPAGAARQEAARALERAGYAVATAREAYEATYRFVTDPCDLVLLSLRVFGRRDRAFLGVVRRARPDARVVLLVPEGRRATALRLLAAGADAWLPEPCYPDELTALARGFARPHREAETDPERPWAALGSLAGEVAHAVYNPLQILALLREDLEAGERAHEVLGEGVERIGAVVRLLERFGRVGGPRPRPARVGAVLQEAVEAAAGAGVVAPRAPLPRPGPVFAFDPDLVRAAFESLLEVLAAHSSRRPLPVRAGLRPRRLEAGGGEAADVRSGLEALLKGRDVEIDGPSFEALGEKVIWSHPETRRPHAGLALPRRVAHLHGGALEARAARGGTVLAFVLPLAPPAAGSRASA